MRALLRTMPIRSRIVLFFLVATAMGALSMAHLVDRDDLPRAYGWLVALMAAAFVAGRAVAASVTEPLVELAGKLEKLASGQWDQVLKDRSGDEVAAVIDALNRYVMLRDNEPLAGAGQLARGAEPEAAGRETAGLAALLDCARELQAVHDFGDGAGRLLAVCNAHLRLEWSSVCMLDAARKNLELVASSGLSEDLSHELALAGARPVSGGAREGIAGEVLASGVAVIVDRGERDARFKGPPNESAKPKRVRSLACLPIPSPQGAPAGVANFVNIAGGAGFGEADLAFLNRAAGLLAGFHRRATARQDAFREAVSGLHEYAHWRELFAVECQRHRRKPSRLSVLELKCAFPKGAPSAAEQNTVFASVGTALRESLRNHDGATRRKDSFYVFLPDTDTLGALFLAGRIKDRVDSMGAAGESAADPAFVAAIGLACCPEHVADPEQLPEACDVAVHESTRIGDHRLVCYQKSMPGAAEAAREEGA